MCVRKVTEWCPHCETEVKLKGKMAVQECPNCGMYIVPCSMCDYGGCADCEYDRECERLNEGRKPKVEVKSIAVIATENFDY